jgi:flagellar biogenesis protein FliO
MDSSLLEIGFKMSIALGVVLLTFGAAIVVAKKFFGKGLPVLGKKDTTSSKARLRVENTRVLGQGRNLHVVRFGDKTLLLGATTHSINVLCKVEEGDDDEEDSFESLLNSSHEENKEKGLMSQLGSRLKEISRV